MRIERTHAFEVARDAAEAFPLFTPEGERAWAEGWEPRYAWPADGRTERGMVFTTEHGGEHTIWTLTRYDPESFVVEYVRDTPGSRTGEVRVKCAPLSERRTRVEVTYVLTALSEAGKAKLAELDEARFRGFVERWREAIERL